MMGGRHTNITITVNGRLHTVVADSGATLLQTLRNDLGLNAPKYGCGLGQCGACLVLLGGRAARSCVLPVRAAAGLEVTTLEGLARDGVLHPVQQAFVAKQGAQCGYCLNGMIMRTVALLETNSQPSELDIRQALRHNLCRCGTHREILESVRHAVTLMGQAR